MAEVVRIHNGSGFCVAVLGNRGRVWTPYVSIDAYPIRKHKIRTAKLAKYCKPLELRGKPYPLTRAAKQMLRVGRNMGITKGAKALLKEALA